MRFTTTADGLLGGVDIEPVANGDVGVKARDEVLVGKDELDEAFNLTG